MSVYIILVKGTGQIEKKLAQCQIGAALLLDAQERRASKLVVVWLLSGIVPSFYHQNVQTERILSLKQQHVAPHTMRHRHVDSIITHHRILPGSRLTNKLEIVGQFH